MQFLYFFIRLNLVSAVLVFTATSQAAQLYAPDNSNWEFEGDQVELAEIAGRHAIRIGSGRASLKDLEFENGTIEFDIFLPRERAFAYLYFRGQSDQELESLYIRAHKSTAPDAIQYAPVFQRQTAWQLYHGERGTGAASFPANRWFHVKVELMGERMQVWLGENTNPILDIKQLGRESKAGWIAFRGFVPGSSAAEFSSYISNVRVTKSEVEIPIVSRASKLAEGQISQWRVSPSFDSKPGPINEVPANLRDKMWSTPPMQDHGVFEFLRSKPIPKGSKHWSVVAEVSLIAKQAQTCAIHLGYSDEITLSLNDRLILFQDASYRFTGNRQEGLMHMDQLIAYLPLQPGVNLLRAVVSDRFGGWGLSGHLKNCSDVELR